MNANDWLLVLSLALLGAAPIIHRYAVQYNRSWQALNWFTKWAVVIVIFTHLIPESIDIAGWSAVLPIVIGLALPSIFEQLSRVHAGRVHLASIAISLVGLAVHALFDGAALALPGLHDHASTHGHTHVHALPMAIILHRTPVGLFIWDLCAQHGSWRLGMMVLSLNALATMVGYHFGAHFFAAAHDSVQLAYFQALFAGTLLHVLVHNTNPSHSSSCSH